MVDDEGIFEVLIHWKYHERIWEPLLQFCGDVPDRLVRYVRDCDDTGLS